MPLIPDGLQAEEILSRGLIAAFLHVRPALVCAPPTDAASAGRGWPSPRTWEMAARLMAAGNAAGATQDARSALIRGAVGDGAGIEFLAWLVEMDLPDPEVVLADPTAFRLPERGDRAYAALAAIASAVAGQLTAERWTAGWRVLGIAADTAPDVAAVAARVLARCRPEGATLPAEIKRLRPHAPRRRAAVLMAHEIAAARLWAATRFPYLASGIFGMTLIEDPGSGTVAVDDSWRMHIDPDLTVWWTPSQVGSVMVHLVCHLLRTHGERAQAIGVGPDDVSRWIRAADAEINDDLVPAGLDLPRTPLLPSDLGAPAGLLAEQYYTQEVTTDSSDLPMNCGSGAHGQPGTCGCQAGKCHGGLPRWQAELLRRQIAAGGASAHSKLRLGDHAGRAAALGGGTADAEGRLAAGARRAAAARGRRGVRRGRLLVPAAITAFFRRGRRPGDGTGRAA